MRFLKSGRRSLSCIEHGSLRRLFLIAVLFLSLSEAWASESSDTESISEIDSTASEKLEATPLTGIEASFRISMASTEDATPLFTENVLPPRPLVESEQPSFGSIGSDSQDQTLFAPALAIGQDEVGAEALPNPDIHTYGAAPEEEFVKGESGPLEREVDNLSEPLEQDAGGPFDISEATQFVNAVAEDVLEVPADLQISRVELKAVADELNIITNYFTQFQLTQAFLLLTGELAAADQLDQEMFNYCTGFRLMIDRSLADDADLERSMEEIEMPIVTEDQSGTFRTGGIETRSLSWLLGFVAGERSLNAESFYVLDRLSRYNDKLILAILSKAENLPAFIPVVNLQPVRDAVEEYYARSKEFQRAELQVWLDSEIDGFFQTRSEPSQAEIDDYIRLKLGEDNLNYKTFLLRQSEAALALSKLRELAELVPYALSPLFNDPRTAQTYDALLLNKLVERGLVLRKLLTRFTSAVADKARFLLAFSKIRSRHVTSWFDPSKPIASIEDYIARYAEVLGDNPHLQSFVLPVLRKLQATQNITKQLIVDLDPSRTSVTVWLINVPKGRRAGLIHFIDPYPHRSRTVFDAKARIKRWFYNSGLIPVTNPETGNVESQPAERDIEILETIYIGYEAAKAVN